MRIRSNSARWLRNEACSKCGSRDNKAVYDDGSTWCFGCCTYGAPKFLNIQENEEVEKEILSYPNRLSKDLFPRNKKWLHAYGLSDGEMEHFMMDEQTKRHVFLHYEKDELTYYEARSVTGEKPKCLSKGIKPIHLFRNFERGDIICLTEDVVSAILVSRDVTAGCLFGSALSDHQLTYLRGYSRIIIWLDYDKTDTALKWVDKLSSRGYNVALVIEDRGDPKDLSPDLRTDNLAQALLDLSANRGLTMT